MTQPAFVQLDGEGGWEAVLAALPSGPGVGQFLADAGRNLLIGRSANLRRWAGSHLGVAQSRRRAGRPRTDLRPVAKTLRFAQATSAFHQLWLFERLMATQVNPAERRDLRVPAYLRLDLQEPFPRLSVVHGAQADAGGIRFGPFRDARAAVRAADALSRRFGLRPCEASFEPHPELPLGLRCVYAQVEELCGALPGPGQPGHAVSST